MPLIIQNKLENWLIGTFSRDLTGIARNSVLIGEVNVSLTGKVSITNLVINNTDGYESSYALKIDKIIISISPIEFITKTISNKDYNIDSITIKDPVFLIENQNNILNIDAIQKQKDEVVAYRPNKYKYFKVNKLVILDGLLQKYKQSQATNTPLFFPFM